MAGLFVLLLSASTLSQTDTPDATFDTPIDKKVVDFGLSSANPPGRQTMRNRLSCYFYANFMVKEHNDQGMKGAELLTITPITGQAQPACSQEIGPGETVIGKEGKGWWGYYWGAKGNYVFFSAADGWDGGIPFAIYNFKTGKKVFEDSSYEGGNWNLKPEPSPFNSLRVTAVQSQPLTLKYLRVVEAKCDLHLWKKEACWSSVRRRLGLKDAKTPICSGYDDIDIRYDSAIAYPVEVSLTKPPVAKTTAGPVKCWPVD